VPEWASTHPDPASRVRAALGRAGANATGLTNRDAFLARIDGLMYDDDPKQGIVNGRSFVHPEFRLAFEAPNGFYMVNGSRAVSINGQTGKGELSTAPFNGNLDAYVGSIFSALSQGSQQQIVPQSIQRTTVNGIPAAYGVARARTQAGQVDVAVFAYEFSNNQAFHFMTIAQAGRSSVFNPMFGSMRRISANEAAAVRPRRIDVVTVGANDTLQSMAARMAYTSAQLERFLVLNGLTTSSRLAAGQKVKIVTY
jgi:predicted Zn-dependent protease